MQAPSPSDVASLNLHCIGIRVSTDPHEPMDHSAISGGASKSRQKNCYGCVQAKKRCDRRAPICSRCAERKIACISGKPTAPSQLNRADFLEPSTVIPSMGRLDVEGPGWHAFLPGPSSQLHPYPLGVAPIDPQLGLASAAPGSIQDSELMGATIDGDISMGAFLNNLADDTLQDRWLAQPGEGCSPERPSTPADQEVIRAYEKMSSCVCLYSRFPCRQMLELMVPQDNIEPWRMYDPKQPLHNIITRVKRVTREVATQNSTPFLHRHLYRDYVPPCMLACFAANVLYENRTEATTSMVMRALEDGVRELIETEARRLVATPLERLARTQALFLYQIIRLLDGDVMLRTQAEKDIPLLQTWLCDLGRIRDNLGGTARLGDGEARKQPPREWEVSATHLYHER